MRNEWEQSQKDMAGKVFHIRIESVVPCPEEDCVSVVFEIIETGECWESEVRLEG